MKNSEIFRSEIVGVNESRSLMKKRIGNFSRLDRFRTRNKNKQLSTNKVIKKASRNRNKDIRGASSIFESLSKCIYLYYFFYA